MAKNCKKCETKLRYKEADLVYCPNCKIYYRTEKDKLERLEVKHG